MQNIKDFIMEKIAAAQEEGNTSGAPRVRFVILDLSPVTG